MLESLGVEDAAIKNNVSLGRQTGTVHRIFGN
jgi:hypothetical protein